MTRNVKKKKKTAMNSYRPKNVLSMAMITVIVIVLFVVVQFNCRDLKARHAELEKKELSLIEQIEEQNEKAREIEAYGEYKQTKQYVEDIAKERLGLVYKDEIIFEAEN